MRVLVTGGSGFLAAWVMRRLLARHVSLRAFDLRSDARLLGELAPRQAGAVDAKYLLVTMAANSNPAPAVMQARELNPDMHILVRTRYLKERNELAIAGVTGAVFEEAEAAIALGELVLKDLGADAATIDKEIAALRTSVASGVIG